MSEEEPPTIDSLPDEALLTIFQDLSNARTVAAIAPVCRRWNHLTRYIHSLIFTISAPSDVAAVAPMLNRAESIHRLTIDTTSDSVALPEEELYQWINLVSPSLQELTVTITTPSKNPVKIWDHLAKCRHLSSLKVHGCVTMFFPVLRSTMQSLRECVLDDSTSLKYPAVQTVLENCPELEKLVVTNFPTLKIKLFHKRLVTVHLQAEPLPDPEANPPFILLEAASLKFLTLDGISCVLYAPELLELHLPSRCKDLIVVSLDKVRLLTMGGSGWEFKEIHSVVELVPNISEMRIEASVSDPEPVDWKAFFHGLSNLSSITLGGNMLQCFCKEVDGEVLAKMNKVVSVTVRLQEDCVELLQALLVYCSALKVLLVDCSDVLQIEGERLSSPMEELFEARHPQLFSDLHKMQTDHPKVVHLSFRC